MDYEKKYKEALGWMQSIYDGLHGATKEDAERYFPELKESRDERIRQELIAFLIYYNTGQGKRVVHCDDWISWLEKQKPTEWSEHQHKLLNYAISMTDDTEVKCFLESLRNTGSNTSAEWSEVDSAMMNLLIEELNSIAKHNGCLKQYKPEINWLKSLKPNNWKPSEFQLECLRRVIPHQDTEIGNEIEYVLTELYDNLKKL